MISRLTIPVILSFAAAGCVVATAGDLSRQTFIIANSHPASCGWLTDFSTERNYCANNCLNHLDRIAADPEYAYALSEVNNMIAILNFAPNRFQQLKQRIAEGRVEPVNAMFLEPTICLSGGEALVKQGVEGIRWQRAMLGMTPRHAWMIDVTGMHEQMAQIVGSLGLDALVYCRNNISGSTLHWLVSPDGTRTLGIATGRYAQWPSVFRTTKPLDDQQMQTLLEQVQSRRCPSGMDGKWLQTPDGAPYLVLAGSGDYSLAPAYKKYPSELIQRWNKTHPDYPLRFTTPAAYVDAVMPDLKAGGIQIPTVHDGWPFTGWHAFWAQNPTVKQRYRRSEHALQAAEALATVASLSGAMQYPAQDLYHAWLLMLLNMDRNTLWGAAGGMVFEHPTSWDAKDRFDWVDRQSAETSGQAIRSVRGTGDCVALFNPANWVRNDPVVIQLGKGMGLEGAACQDLGDGRTLCRAELPSVGMASYRPRPNATPARRIPLPETIETKFYSAEVDPEHGDLVSLKLKPTGRQMLGGPANVLVAETSGKGRGQGGSAGNQLADRPDRKRLGASSDSAACISVTTGPLATVVEARREFYGGQPARRIITFYHDDPRIDFDTYLQDIPDQTVVLAEFPLAGEVTDVRRAIPYGFCHGGWPLGKPGATGYVRGITPAVRWSHYTLARGGGVAILDRGVTGREINGNTPVIYLLNATDRYMGYPNPWLSGKGRHHLQYAIVAHDTPWDKANVPRLAWQYNARPIVARATASGPDQSLVQTSDNVIVQALRREGMYIELRLVECLGRPGKATVTVNLPHRSAAMTDLLGRRGAALTGGPTYSLDVSPQQIVTIRLRTSKAVDKIRVLTDWSPLVPAGKRPALKRYLPGVLGHPPRG